MSPLPRDDDEDIAPRKPSARHPAPLAPPPPKPASSVAWGFVGQMHRIESLIKFPGQTGIVRLLPNTIKYERPPTEIGWIELKEQKGRFEMAWPGNPTAARTLEDVGIEARMAKGKGYLPSNHPILRELDDAVLSLVKQAEKLGRSGWGLGLITPAGIVLNQTPEGVSAVPVDLGFTWIGEFGDPPWDHSPGKPAWLADDSSENPASNIWERSPVEQQFAGPGKSPFPAAESGADVQTMARLLAWVLTGKPSRNLAAEPGAIWSVLLPAAVGDVATMRDFLGYLKDSPPSTHFTAPPKPIQMLPDAGREKKSSMGLILAGLALVLLLAGAAGAYFAFLQPDKSKEVAGPGPIEPKPQPVEPEVPGTDPNGVEKAAKEFDAANDLDDQLKKFRELAQAAAGNADPSAVARVGAARQKLFGEWVGTCEKQLDTSADAAKRGEAGHQLRKLTDDYAAIHKDFPPTDAEHRAKEQQWLEQYDRQAELLGWPR